MAGTLLHLTLADRALKGADIAEETRLATLEAIDDYRLGAVLIDLPFYQSLMAFGLRMLLHREIQFSQWGTRLHTRSPLALCRALLDGADDAPGRAMALGSLTHLAVDAVFHVEIERWVSAEDDGTKGPNARHKCIEDQMDLHAHRYLLGHTGIGTPYAYRHTCLKPLISWRQRAGQAMLTAYGETPDATEFARWLRSLARFGLLHSSPLFPWVRTRPAENRELSDTAVALTEQAIDLAARYIELGAAYLIGKVGADTLAAGIPDRNLTDGKEASPARAR